MRGGTAALPHENDLRSDCPKPAQASRPDPVRRAATQTARTGFHLIADLYDCDLAAFVRSEADMPELRQLVSSALIAGGFTELGSYYHYFGQSAVTATVCLAESHLSFHTWPEERYVSFDLFACSTASTDAAPRPDRAQSALEKGDTRGDSPTGSALQASCEHRVREVFARLAADLFRPGSVSFQALYR